MSLRERTARYTVYGLLGTWLAATVLGQDPNRKFDAVRRLDPTGLLIPDWRFFAPRPGMHDNHLLVRDELADGELTEWQEGIRIETRAWHHFLWYPGRRPSKIVSDAVIALIMLQKDLADRKENVQVSLPYLCMLNHATHHVPHHPDSKRVQFMIVNSTGYDRAEKPTVVFLSNLHPLA